MAQSNKNKHYCQIIEAAIFAAGKPLSIDDLKASVLSEFKLSLSAIRNLVREVQQSYEGRGIELVTLASGYRFQTIADVSPWLSHLWTEKAPRYSRAMLETLSLIAYKQPITRGEIEQVRGVAVSSNIIRAMQERGWIKVVGHKEIPGRPALFATTPAFLDYFGLESLDQLPQLETVAPTTFELGVQQPENQAEKETTPQSDSGESDVRETSKSISESR
ncbi:SMC-Scp complex subunit ScpB [Catenovulum sp. SM1970]|nr:SMC-Scp complex subunit ScpB [Marinifaba aquimaris]